MNELISHLFRLEMSFVVVITRAFCAAAARKESLAVGRLVVRQPAHPLGLRCFCVSFRPSPSLPVPAQGLSHFRCPLHPEFK